MTESNFILVKNHLIAIDRILRNQHIGNYTKNELIKREDVKVKHLTESEYQEYKKLIDNDEQIA